MAHSEKFRGKGIIIFENHTNWRLGVRPNFVRKNYCLNQTTVNCNKSENLEYMVVLFYLNLCYICIVF